MAHPYLVSSVSPIQGFHPISSSTLYFAGSAFQSVAHAYSACHVYLYYRLPPLLLIDTHELAERRKHYGYTYWGTRDLEKPMHALPPEERIGEVLLRVKVPEQLWEHRIPDDNWRWEEETVPGQGGGWKVDVEVPMHLRYGTPRSTRSGNEEDPGSSRDPYEKVTVDWPHAFLLCPISTSLKPQHTLPHGTLPAHVFDALPTGHSRTKIIIPIPPHSNYTKSTPSTLNATSPPPQSTPLTTSTTLLLPVGDTSDLAFVEPVTALTILVCFVWLWRVSWKTARRLNAASSLESKEKVL
ncbi:PIG-X [Crepidotus variabilis]|uniref:Protein PBN1 n=1 Tax=Crepidotus variabilis TaxID=179855 RepID=A0A9P6EI53_9AGAR|nr:PIG-X [Crepidotus variabilis]